MAHEPMAGRPMRGEPVYNSNSAGAWLNWSVFMDLMKHTSSTISARPCTGSDSHAPLRPYWANLWGVPSSFGTPLVKAKRRPLRNSSGAGLSFSSTSFGL
jgi:hypothetical protein